MKLSPYVIQELAPIIIGDPGYAPYRKGPVLVKLFNKYGAKDVYDEKGLPDVKKTNGQRPSRTEYAKVRLQDLNGKAEIRELLTEISNALENREVTIETVNMLLEKDGYSLIKKEDGYIIQGGVIDKTKPIINEAHFKNIEEQILNALDAAKVTIIVAMGWFTNETLNSKLLEKQAQGVDVRIILYDDSINKKHGVDLSGLPHKKIKGERGGIMHHKFCVIDNQVVITGSYNWSNNAEFRNTENITIEKDPEQATRYSVEFKKLSS